MRTGGAWCSRCSSTPKTGGKRSAGCPSCARRWMPSRIPSTACSSTAVAAAGQVPGSRAGRSPRRARLPFRGPGLRTSRIWIWPLSPHRLPGRRRQGRYSGRRIHAVPGLAEMTLTDTVPVLRPSVRGTEELAAIGRSVTGRECLKRSHAPEPPIWAQSSSSACPSVPRANGQYVIPHGEGDRRSTPHGPSSATWASPHAAPRGPQCSVCVMSVIMNRA
jgi:hypothetical protein